MKIRRITDLQERLDEDLSWRRRELSDIKKLIRTSEGSRQTALLRSSVPLLYAHWEGFIKNASIHYASFLSRQGLRYRDMKECFMGLPAKGALDVLVQAKKPYAFADAVASIFRKTGEAVDLRLSDYIGNVGNLNHDLFVGIAKSLDLHDAAFEAFRNLIDERLLKSRNKIAHGEHVMVDAEGFPVLADEVLQIMQNYKTAIENAASTKSYIRQEADSGEANQVPA